jgi:hypothetical protein
VQTRLSEIEKLLITEQLRAEELCARKAQNYLSMSRDPAIQGLLQQSIQKGQRHMGMLNGLLQEAGLSGGMPSMSGH